MSRRSSTVKRTVCTLIAPALLTVLAFGCARERSEPPTSAPVSTAGRSSVPRSPPCAGADECTTRQLADTAGVTLGTAVGAPLLGDPTYRSTLVDTFNSVTPENELKWASIHPAPGEWDFGPADQIVDFAREHDLAVKGHTLIWDQELIDSTPDWVLEIRDPDELRAAVTEHIATVMDRYRDSVDRWDVVNEPIETLGTDLYDNHFRQVLGDDYIAWMFRTAHAAAPDEQLWLNEAAVEYQPGKAAALVALVAGLVEQDVPIDGVGIQGHLVGGTVDAVALERLVADLEVLGVEVAVTELDVPARDPVDPLSVQAGTYRGALGACLANRCREVTLWGFTDRHTWIDATFGEGLAPLPFDEDYRPKPALEAIRESLLALRERG
jgi:endo-1,4-beta-xylanase